MKILAIEFSTERRSVAVVSASAGGPAAVLGAARSDSRDVGALTLVQQAFDEAKCAQEDIGCLAIGLGPGSYTGIRVAVALGQGWQLATDAKLMGISTVECLAEQARREKLFGHVSFLVDAQRGEFYHARYRITEATVEIVEPLRIATRDAVDAVARAGDALVGPEVTRWFPNGRVLVPEAGVLGQLAAGRSDFVAGDKLEPIYLREPNFVKAPPPRVVS